MIPLYSRESVNRLDRQAMTLDAQPSRQLMARAARAVWNCLTETWPRAERLLILAGPGNNGGDAWALAGLALRARLKPRVIALGDPERSSPEARAFRESYLQRGGEQAAFDGTLPEADVIVDGLFGIGLDKPLRDQPRQLIEAVNARDTPVLAIDIPSGLDAETGRPLPQAIKAAATVTFIARKSGQFLADGPDFCGRLHFDALGLSRAARRTETPQLQRLERADLRWPAPRPRNTHKYRQGSILVIGGDRQMAGAAILAGQAALAAGAGLVRLCMHRDNLGRQLAAAPELMCCAWDDLQSALQRASLLLVGPGLGQGEEARQLLHRLQSVDKPMLIDADALQDAFIDALATNRRLLTPHAGEAARLLGVSSAQIQDDRLQALGQLVARHRATVLLKGQDNLIADPTSLPRLCGDGHPGMATAGMGDVLSGIAAALWAQGLQPLEAAATASCWQAAAANAAVKFRWNASLTATEVIESLGTAARELRSACRG